MRLFRAFALLGLVLVAGLLASAVSPAFAQADTTISIGGFLDPLRPLLVEVITLAIAALLGWITLKLKTKLNLDIEAKHRDALHSALMNGVLKGLHYVEERADRMTIDVRSAMLAEALRYAQAGAPDAIKFFGLTPERLRELLEAKLPAIERPVDG